MSVCVLIKPSVRETFSALLTGLAICDTFFLVCSLLIFGLPRLLSWFTKQVRSPVFPYIFCLLHIFRVGSTYLTLSVTLERYWAICHPLSRQIKQRYLLIGKKQL